MAKTQITDTQLLDTLRKKNRTSAQIATALGLPAPFAITARLASLQKRGAIRLLQDTRKWQILEDADTMASRSSDAPLSAFDERLPRLFSGAGWGRRYVWDGQRMAIVHIDGGEGIEYIGANAGQSADLIYWSDPSLPPFRLRRLDDDRIEQMMRHARDEDALLTHRMAKLEAKKKKDEARKARRQQHIN